MNEEVGLANENSKQGTWWAMSLEQKFTIHSFAVQCLMVAWGSPRKDWKMFLKLCLVKIVSLPCSDFSTLYKQRLRTLHRKIPMSCQDLSSYKSQ